MATVESPIKYELQRDWEEEVWNTQQYQDQLQQYKDLLMSTGQAAQTQYQQQAQTAAKQASYDISGAYANYLKQQRNVLNQGQLESGHKEELGSALLSAYGGAYQQARAEQAKTTASAASEYAQNLSYAQQTYQKNYEALQKSAQQEATLMASIFKKAEEAVALLDQTGLKMYETNKETGELELTPWGIEQFRSYLLKDDSFKQALGSAKMEDELAYYLSKSQDLHSNLFGFSETDYSAPETQEISKLSKLQTEGYVETMDAPKLNLNWNDFAGWDFGVKGHDKLIAIGDELDQYAIDLGLTEEELSKEFGISRMDAVLGMIGHKASAKLRENKYQDVQAFVKDEYNKLLNKLQEMSRKKYIKE